MRAARRRQAPFVRGGGREQAYAERCCHLVIGLLAIAALAVGYLIYQEEQKSGIDIQIGESGITIEER